MVLITIVDGKTKIESIQQIDKVTVNKLENSVNSNRITAHLKDIHAQHEVIIGKDGAESHLFKVVDATTEHDIKVIKSQHSSFLEHVEKMPEIDAICPVKTKEQEEKLKSAAELLKTLNEDCEGEDFIYMGVKLIGPFLGAVCAVNSELLKEMVDCYIDKHINNG